MSAPVAPQTPSAKAPSPPTPALPANPAPRKKGSGFLKGCGCLLVLVFVCGVAGQLGLDWWKGHQKQAEDEAFYALARPLLGTWKVVEDPGEARYSYTTRLMSNQTLRLPGEGPWVLFIDCEEPKARNWMLSSAENGHLVGGGIDN